MGRLTITLITVLLFVCVGSLPVLGQSRGRSSGSSSSRTSSGSASKTVYVGPYTRRDGTRVSGYWRSAPGTSSATSSTTTSNAYRLFSTASTPTDTNYGTTYGTSNIVNRDANGRIIRSSAARTEFKKLHPCPATGSSTGACPGYVIDHIVPLANGGPDAPSNMQWQTIAEAKEKDRWERRSMYNGSTVNLPNYSIQATATQFPSYSNATGSSYSNVELPPPPPIYREPITSDMSPIGHTSKLNSYLMESDKRMRIGQAQRLKNLGIEVNWEDHSYLDMADWESRAQTAERLKRLGIDVSWRDHSLLEMMDWEGRANTADRLRRLGVSANWREHSLMEMMDWESRINTASRLRLRGISVDWRQHSSMQLLEMEFGRP